MLEMATTMWVMVKLVCVRIKTMSLSIGDRKLTVQPLLDPPLASPNNRGSILHGGSI